MLTTFHVSIVLSCFLSFISIFQQLYTIYNVSLSSRVNYFSIYITINIYFRIKYNGFFIGTSYTFHYVFLTFISQGYILLFVVLGIKHIQTVFNVSIFSCCILSLSENLPRRLFTQYFHFLVISGCHGTIRLRSYFQLCFINQLFILRIFVFVHHSVVRH